MIGGSGPEQTLAEADKARRGTWVPLVITTFLLLLSCGALVFLDHLSDGNLYYTAPAQIVLGSAVVMLLFLFVVIGFRRMDIHSSGEALGLPEGSIRALIAVILIVIFFILANIIFGSLQGAEVRVPFRSVPRAVVDAARSDEGTEVVVTGRESVSEAGTSVELLTGEYLRSPNSDTAEQVGLQLLTALITLVTAISAFYFGSNSVRAATASVTRALGRGDETGGGLSIVDPSGSPAALIATDGKWLPVRIAFNRGGVNVVEVAGDSADAIAWNAQEEAFLYFPKEPADTVTIRFALRDHPTIGSELRLQASPPPSSDPRNPQGNAKPKPPIGASPDPLGNMPNRPDEDNPEAEEEQ